MMLHIIEIFVQAWEYLYSFVCKSAYIQILFLQLWNKYNPKKYINFILFVVYSRCGNTEQFYYFNGRIVVNWLQF